MQERLASGNIQCCLVSAGILLGSSWAKMSRLTVPLNPLRGSFQRLRSPGETADQLKHRDAALESRAPLRFRDRGRPDSVDGQDGRSLIFARGNLCSIDSPKVARTA